MRLHEIQVQDEYKEEYARPSMERFFPCSHPRSPHGPRAAKGSAVGLGHGKDGRFCGARAGTLWLGIFFGTGFDFALFDSHFET